MPAFSPSVEVFLHLKQVTSLSDPDQPAIKGKKYTFQGHLLYVFRFPYLDNRITFKYMINLLNGSTINSSTNSSLEPSTLVANGRYILSSFEDLTLVSLHILKLLLNLIL